MISCALFLIDLSLIPLLSHMKWNSDQTPVLGAQHIRDSAEKKQAKSLTVSLGKALNGILSSLCGRLVMNPRNLPVALAQSM